MNYEDIDYPSVGEVEKAVKEYVEVECGGKWPSDAWFDLGEHWSVNVWREDGCRRITVYHDFINRSGYRQTYTFAGIAIH